MKPHVFIFALSSCMVFGIHGIFAQPNDAPSACEYNETRGDQAPINPKTNKPYTPDERNQEPFDGGSISQNEIKECLKAEVSIINHHIVFEDYRDAWQELAKETGNYTISLLIEGGVLHAKRPYNDTDTNTAQDDQGGINLGVFRDPTIYDSSRLTEEEITEFSIEKTDRLIALIRPRIEWVELTIDSTVSITNSVSQEELSGQTILYSIFSNVVDLSRTSFLADVSFNNVIFSGEITYFSNTVFLGKVNFDKSAFPREIYFDEAFFSGITNFTESLFSGIVSFKGLHVVGEVIAFSKSSFSGEVSFSEIIITGIANFSRSSFTADVIDFSKASFSGEITSFRQSSFFGKLLFNSASFLGNTSFSNATLSGESYFNKTHFSGKISFSGVNILSDVIFFDHCTFFGEIAFDKISSSGNISFQNTTFSGKMTYFDESSFSGNIIFQKTIFLNLSTTFNKVVFSGELTDFSQVSFSGNISFQQSQFKGNADFSNMNVSGILFLDNTTWEKRVDLRSISVKELQWDSTNDPSNVNGIFDMRDAYIGSVTLKEVKFNDLVNISGVIFGKFRTNPSKISQDFDILNADFMDTLNTDIFTMSSVKIHLENNIFDKEADLLHITFDGPAIFLNNRFHDTLDLTGSTFDTKKSCLCLSYNRFNRLVFDSQHLGNPPGISPYQQIVNFFSNPILTSRVRPLTSPDCNFNSTPTNYYIDNNKNYEPLSSIYNTLGHAFFDSNNRLGINETWYLKTVANRNEKSKVIIWLEWIFFDVPSRYSIDVWRTMWISIFIMITFYIIYMSLLGGFYFFHHAFHFFFIHFNPKRRHHRVAMNKTIQIPSHPQRQRAFRFRLFEPMHVTSTQSRRLIIPWRDAAMLSLRAFLKLGLGTRYPNSQPLKAFMYLEWALGVFMLIHFILAVKNNLPFILPFLGVAN